MKNYTVKIIGIKDINRQLLHDFIEFEQSWIDANKHHKILILHYLLDAFNGNKQEINNYIKNGWEVYTIEPHEIGGASDVHIKETCKEYNYRMAV